MSDRANNNDKRTGKRPAMSIAEAYELLGLRTSAGREEVQATYRRLALKYHPDRNPGSIERFKELATAYRLLQNKFRLDSSEAERLRAECDRCGEYGIVHAATDGSHCCAACLSIANRRPLLPAPPITIVTCATTIVLLALSLGSLMVALGGDAQQHWYAVLSFVLGLAALLSLAATCLTVVYTAEPRHLLGRGTVRSVRRHRPRGSANSFR